MAQADFDKYSQMYQPDGNHTLSFRAFVQYIVDTDRRKINNHFKSVEELCSPCVFPFDYVVKTETSLADSTFVTNGLNLQLPNLNSMTSELLGAEEESEFWKINRQFVAEQFAKIEMENKLKLLELYKHDFVRYEYGFDLVTNLVYFED